MADGSFPPCAFLPWLISFTLLSSACSLGTSSTDRWRCMWLLPASSRRARWAHTTEQNAQAPAWERGRPRAPPLPTRSQLSRGSLCSAAWPERSSTTWRAMHPERTTLTRRAEEGARAPPPSLVCFGRLWCARQGDTRRGGAHGSAWLGPSSTDTGVCKT